MAHFTCVGKLVKKTKKKTLVIFVVFLHVRESHLNSPVNCHF